MRNKDFAWLYLFLFATLADLFFILENKSDLRIFSKPLIILGLIIYFYLISKPIARTLLSRTIMGALIFSWIGDIFLLWPELFAFGLGSFLMAHICYIIGFKVAQKNPGEIGNVNFVKTFLFNLPFYILAAFVYYLIQPNLGVLKIPVIVYVIAIISMVTMARERYGKVHAPSFWQVMIGATLFFISDGILAINRFYLEFPEAGILVMGTYAVGQLLIIMGIRSFIIQPQ
ncbi:lysoplasmalogenase [Algoriphagus halophilus]|uniref:lysoplasmalogenase n=1 Tax=Algoriphagus halophilus TaxID=226505 RepID=UPI0035902E3D